MGARLYGVYGAGARVYQGPGEDHGELPPKTPVVEKPDRIFVTNKQRAGEQSLHQSQPAEAKGDSAPHPQRVLQGEVHGGAGVYHNGRRGDTFHLVPPQHIF